MASGAIPSTAALALCAALVGGSADAAERGLQRAPAAADGPMGPSFAPVYGESHALLIGAGRYRAWPTLSSVPAELDEVADALRESGFEITRIDDPDIEALRGGVRRFVDEHGYAPDNRLLVYFSGHGHSIRDRGFLLPVDAPLPDDPAFRRRALPMTQVLAWARDLEAKHALFVFDSCFSGTVFKSRSLPGDAERYVRAATARPVRQFITAGDADQEVPARSTFTPAFVDAIRGAGDLNGDGYVTGSELGVHLSQLVPRFVDQTPQYGKIRDYELSRGDFVFFLNGTGRDGARNDDGADEAGDLELALWRSAERDDDRVAYRAYLGRFTDGAFAGIARSRLARLLDEDIDAVVGRLDRAASEIDESAARATELGRTLAEQEAEIDRRSDELGSLGAALSERRAERAPAADPAARRAALAQENARLQRLASEYAAALTDRITAHWQRPEGVDDVDCIVEITQSINGDVLDARVRSCEGTDPVLRNVLYNSIARAVYGASPLPETPDPQLFDRRVRIRFRS